LVLSTGSGRLYGIAGLLALLVIVIGGILGRTALTPKPTPAPATATATPLLPTLTDTPVPATPTPTPTHTPVTPSPTPTVTPIFASNAPYRVVVAEFDGQKASRQIEIARRLEEDLTDNLEDVGLDEDVDVEIVADVIIWSVRRGISSQTWKPMCLSGAGMMIQGFTSTFCWANATLPALCYDGVEKGNAPGYRNEISDLSFYVRDKLPSNTIFLPMFVIGHLYYLSNNYSRVMMHLTPRWRTSPKQ
jgi:hypothetical protein